jgi:hypothetical protein
MSEPVQFITEGDTIYALSSDGHTRYQFTLEAEGREQFCECAGFKWSNTEEKRHSRNGAVKDCRHLTAARERAMSASVSPRFRLYHPPSDTVLADKFTSIEAMAYLLDPATSPFSYRREEIEIQKWDGEKSAWRVLPSEPPPVAVMPEPVKEAKARKSKKEPPPAPVKVEEPHEPRAICLSCEYIGPEREWLPEDKCPKCGDLYDKPRHR